MICPICGTFNEDNLQICCNCGKNMTFRIQEHYEYHQYNNQQYHQPNFQQTDYQQANYQLANYQQTNQHRPQPQRNDPGKTLGVVGFALTMASIVFSDGLALAIVGLILSAVAKKQSAKAGFQNSFAKAGVIAGTIITIISAVLLICFLIFYIFYALFIVSLGVLAI